MANIILTSDANHDDGTTRLAGENFTLQLGSVLTIDSCPHLTPMGILGDMVVTEGTINIDGTRTYEIVYSSGSGTFPTAIPTTVTWQGGLYTGKIIRYDSGTGTAGVITVTVNLADEANPPVASDVITDGTWSATVDSIKVGFLHVLGEAQVWGYAAGRGSLIIKGDWYEVGVGTGADSQTITLPHLGHQHAVWVETGSGTGIYEIWHRVGTGTSTVHFGSLTLWGTTFESGFVFAQTIGSSTLTFGTATAGGNPPSGAKIRIPNVHIGTTSVGTPTTEVDSATLTAHIQVLTPNVNTNVNIDHCNFSSSFVDFRGTNSVVCTDSCWGLSTTNATIQKVNATILLDNCALVWPGNITGGLLYINQWTIIDNSAPITINNCVFYGGTNATNIGGLYLQTSANINFTGACKIVSSIQDENTTASLRGATCSNITAETLHLLGGSIILSACSAWEIGYMTMGWQPGRGLTENSAQEWLELASCTNISVNGGNIASGTVRLIPASTSFLLTDCNGIIIRNFGSITNKINMLATPTSLVSFVGLCTNIRLQQLWFTNFNGTQEFLCTNGCSNILIENCSGDYNSELEWDNNNMITKGIHGASGSLGATTGVENDLTNVSGTIFTDYFKSDTTGALGLTFNPPGDFHASDVTIVSGTPIYTGLGDILMRTAGDQVIWEWPYPIKGHTNFQNAAYQFRGTNSVNHTFEYQIDTGSGYGTTGNGPGAWDTITGAHMSAETIFPSGFNIKVRVTASVTSTTNVLDGFAILTNTTLADQEANFYPFSTVNIRVTTKDASEDTNIEGANVLLYRAAGSTVTITRVSTTASVIHTAHGFNNGQKVLISGSNQQEYNGIKVISNVTTNAYDFTVTGTPTTPATGTISAFEVIISGLTNASGYSEYVSYPYSSSFNVTGRVRKGTSSPLYVGSIITGTVNDAGLDLIAYMVQDE